MYKKVTKIMNKSPQNIQNMFNLIANNYDKLNSIISFGFNNIIKSACIKSLHINPNEKVLDLCTGTGDLIKFIKKYSNNVTGVDFSENMLKIARKKFKDTEFIEADCTQLPFDDNSFDIITMGYGLRNIENRTKALQEVYRVLKPNGKFLHLDFGEKNFAGKIFETAVMNLIKFFTENTSSYYYLVKSKQDFPNPKELINETETCHFKLLKRLDYLFKAISAQIYTK